LLLRWRLPRFASTSVAFALLLALAGCGGDEILPAANPPPQFPYAAMPAMPAPPPKPPAAAGPLKVALLVPLSGPNAELGKSMLEAAQMALFTTGSNQLALVPRDTAHGAAGAARSAIADGARLILGPLLAAEVEAVRPVAAAAHVNVIAFSTATELAGGNVYLMGFLPRQEAVREVSFAHERGLGRFAALAPNSPYGHLMGNALHQAAGAAGGTVAETEYFDPHGGDLSGAIHRLLPSGGATPGFDALLLPEGGAQLKEVAHQLQAAGLDTAKVRLLGSGLWDDTSVAGDPALNGGWFAASPPEQRREFEHRFEATYGHPAPRLASLAFDAAALAAVLAREDGSEPFSHDALLNPRGFTGVDGLFRFTPQGLVQRGLAVLEVEAQGNVVVSPAPQSFVDLAY
jgi:ABC-type branched-subunit amino acid transport system substrate-binding protein